MESYKIDVPVLLIFFARSSTFERVFASVREAKPSTLLLWQDGPRPGRTDDLEGIKKCREIAENIDWDCVIYRNYHEENMGCDPSTFNAHKWAFSLVEKCIVLEDDQLPNQSYFRFCKELLDFYEHDTRINHICGYNNIGVSSTCPYSYLFHVHGTGAWASWRRVAQGWDETYSFLHDEYSLKNLKHKKGGKLSLKTAKRHEATGKAYWETILGMDCLLNNRYAIIPQKNLVSNAGLTEDSTHSFAEYKLLSNFDKKLFNAKTYEMEFPMKHPRYVVEDADYAIESRKLMSPNFFVKSTNKLIYLFNCVRYGEFGHIKNAIMRKLNRK